MNINWHFPSYRTCYSFRTVIAAEVTLTENALEYPCYERPEYKTERWVWNYARKKWEQRA